MIIENKIVVKCDNCKRVTQFDTINSKNETYFKEWIIKDDYCCCPDCIDSIEKDAESM